MLSEQAIREFKEIYKEQYGEDITDAEAVKLGINLLTLYDTIYRPLKKEWLTDDAKNHDHTKLPN